MDTCNIVHELRGGSSCRRSAHLLGTFSFPKELPPRPVGKRVAVLNHAEWSRHVSRTCESWLVYKVSLVRQHADTGCFGKEQHLISVCPECCACRYFADIIIGFLRNEAASLLLTGLDVSAEPTAADDMPPIPEPMHAVSQQAPISYTQAADSFTSQLLICCKNIGSHWATTLCQAGWPPCLHTDAAPTAFELCELLPCTSELDRLSDCDAMHLCRATTRGSPSVFATRRCRMPSSATR